VARGGFRWGGFGRAGARGCWSLTGAYGFHPPYHGPYPAGTPFPAPYLWSGLASNYYGLTPWRNYIYPPYQMPWAGNFSRFW